MSDEAIIKRAFEAGDAATSEAPQSDTDEAPPADTSEAPQPEALQTDMVAAAELETEAVKREREVLPKPSKFVYRKDPDAPPDRFPTKPPAHPWERQPGETIRAYRAFEVYRAMDPEERSLKRMSEIIEDVTGPSGKVRRVRPYPWPRITEWSRHNGWVARADAWDTEVTRRTANKQLRDAEKMQDRHRDLALLMQSKVVERLRSMSPDELGRRDLDRWAEKAIRIERQARGLDRVGSAGDAPTVNVGVGVQVGQQQGGSRPANEPQPIDDTPIGEYLLQHPGDVTEAVTNIQDLLELVSGETEGKGG